MNAGEPGFELCEVYGPVDEVAWLAIGLALEKEVSLRGSILYGSYALSLSEEILYFISHCVSLQLSMFLIQSGPVSLGYRIGWHGHWLGIGRLPNLACGDYHDNSFPRLLGLVVVLNVD